MITITDYLMGRDIRYGAEITHQMWNDAEDLLVRVNVLLELFGEPRAVTSGWRPAAVNSATPRAAKYSNHVLMRAIDLEDDDGALDEWCLTNEEQLAELGLWLEHPAATKGWCHLQSVPPRSGRRVFYP